ncbi:mitochondrial ribosomal large subunit component [Blyttiomyces sp. JEL0837]|nr:mitochondrial ribosomal large subunit component [Blyttiomyces sp. JEL0837]
MMLGRLRALASQPAATGILPASIRQFSTVGLFSRSSSPASISTSFMSRTPATTPFSITPNFPSTTPFISRIQTPFAIAKQQSQVRWATYAGLRPRRQNYRKAFKGFFKTREGGSLRGTTLLHGNYGLRVLEGGRIQDKQMDAARTLMRRVLKAEKGAKFHLRVFTDRPVSKKAAETRMGKGKGAVEFYASWVSKGRVVLEVSCMRKDLAEQALKAAAAAMPLRTEFVEQKEFPKVAPRCLPHFLKRRFGNVELNNIVSKRWADLKTKLNGQEETTAKATGASQ